MILEQSRAVLRAHQPRDELHTGTVIHRGLWRLESKVRRVDVQIGVHLRSLGILREKLLAVALGSGTVGTAHGETDLTHSDRDRLRQRRAEVVVRLRQDTSHLRGSRSGPM